MKISGVSVFAIMLLVFVGPRLFAQSSVPLQPQGTAQATPAQPQSQSAPGTPGSVPTLRVYVTRVVLDVVVTDSKGNVVAGLAKDDFKVTDAGEPQTVTNFDVSAAHIAARCDDQLYRGPGPTRAGCACQYHSAGRVQHAV